MNCEGQGKGKGEKREEKKKKKKKKKKIFDVNSGWVWCVYVCVYVCLCICVCVPRELPRPVVMAACGSKAVSLTRSHISAQYGKATRTKK